MPLFKKIFVILAVVGLMVPAFVFAKWGLEGASQETGLIGGGRGVSGDAVPNLIGNIISVALSFVGAIFFLLILYAGFLWMTAFGSTEKVDKAKSILEHAAIGLLIVLASYAISKFVFDSLTGAVGQGSPAEQTSSMGCCFNSDTGGTVQTLEGNCSGSTRTWAAGPCVLGCCSNSATGNSIQTLEGNCSGPTRTWAAGSC